MALNEMVPFEYPQHMFWLRNKKKKNLMRHSYLEACENQISLPDRSMVTHQMINEAMEGFLGIQGYWQKKLKGIWDIFVTI